MKLKLNYDKLKNFQNTNKLKKATLTYIASQLNETEITDLGKLFKSLDKNSDGVLTIDEIKQGLGGNQSYKELDEILKSIDTDGSGKVDYTEFIAATMEKNIYMKEEKLFMAFKMFDIDGSGKISADELKETLGSYFLQRKREIKYFFLEDEAFATKPLSFYEQMIQEADKNGDGEVKQHLLFIVIIIAQIDYHEFILMMEKI